MAKKIIHYPLFTHSSAAAQPLATELSNNKLPLPEAD